MEINLASSIQNFCSHVLPYQCPPGTQIWQLSWATPHCPFSRNQQMLRPRHCNMIGASGYAPSGDWAGRVVSWGPREVSWPETKNQNGSPMLPAPSHSHFSTQSCLAPPHPSTFPQSAVHKWGRRGHQRGKEGRDC